jgi:hypothetical protein
MYIENETPEDITARMLRRISVPELEAKAKALGIFTIDNTDSHIDKHFLYEHGYTIYEYFEAAMDYKSKQVNKLIFAGLEASQIARLLKLAGNYGSIQ